jgi:hypothetical protein
MPEIVKSYFVGQAGTLENPAHVIEDDLIVGWDSVLFAEHKVSVVVVVSEKGSVEPMRYPDLAQFRKQFVD